MPGTFSFRAAPALCLALWFAAGSLSARFLPVAPPPVALVPSAVLWGLTALRPSDAAMAVSAMACGLFSGRLPLPWRGADWPESLKGTFEGEVLGVRDGPYGDCVAAMRVRLSVGESRRAAFDARVVFTGTRFPAVGDAVRFRSFLSVREADGKPWYSGKVSEGGWVRLDRSSLWPPRRVRKVLAEAAGEDGPEAGVFRALAIGDRSAVPWPVARAFRRAGTVHLLAISGLHLACAFAFGLSLGVPLAMVTCGGARPRAAAAVRLAAGLASAATYMAVAGMSPSAVRAFTWALLSGAAVLFGRHCDPLQGAGLCLILAGSLSGSPQPDLSLGLSLLAFIGVVRSMRSGDGAFTRTLRVTIGAFLYTAPLVVAVFGGLPLLSPAFNLAVGVPFTVLLIPAAVAIQWVCFLWPAAVPVLVGAWKVCAAPVLALQGWGANHPAAFLPLGPTGTNCAAIAAAVAVFLWEKGQRGIGAGLALTAAIALAGAAGNHLGSVPPGSLTVLFPNVGQADSAILHSGGTVAVVDCGPPGTRQIEPAVLVFLDREGIGSIDLLVLTHLHPDHAGALRALLRCKRVDRLVVPTVPQEEWESLLEGVPPQSRPRVSVVSEGDRIFSGRLEFLVRHPPAAASPATGNGGSLILEMHWNGVGALFTGDAPWDAVAEAVGLAPRINLFKVPHHGSATGFDPSGAGVFLRRLAADGARVVCPSPPEGGRLPSREVVTAFFRRGLMMRFSGEGRGLRFTFHPGKSEQLLSGLSGIRKRGRLRGVGNEN